MDLERILHRSYQTSVIVAVALSIVFVLTAALVARGTLNLRGALVLDEPSDVTVIATVEPRLQEKVQISKIQFLRKEAPLVQGERPDYDYLVGTSDGSFSLVKLGWNVPSSDWEITLFEPLHADTQQ